MLNTGATLRCSARCAETWEFSATILCVLATHFKDKISEAKADRLQLAKLLALLEAGDILVVTRLDRLARSSATTASKRTSCHAEPWANTKTPVGKLMMTVLVN